MDGVADGTPTPHLWVVLTVAPVEPDPSLTYGRSREEGGELFRTSSRRGGKGVRESCRRV